MQVTSPLEAIKAVKEKLNNLTKRAYEIKKNNSVALNMLMGTGIGYVICRIFLPNGINIQVGQNISPLEGFTGLNIQIGKRLAYNYNLINRPYKFEELGE